MAELWPSINDEFVRALVGDVSALWVDFMDANMRSWVLLFDCTILSVSGIHLGHVQLLTEQKVSDRAEKFRFRWVV